jgi:hypothetical protein
LAEVPELAEDGHIGNGGIVDDEETRVGIERGNDDAIPASIAAVGLPYDSTTLADEADSFGIGGAMGPWPVGWMSVSEDLACALFWILVEAITL